MHYYTFHPADYLLDTSHLEPMEDLAYRRLLDYYYTNESPIPNETQLVSRRLRLGYDLVMKVLQEFFTETENGWIQARCDLEIAAYHHKQQVAKTNGKSGGRPKKTQLVIFANPEETKSKANQEPITSNQVHSDRGTVEEFRQYSVSLGLTVDDGEFLHSYFEGNGWMRGKAPIKCWKSAFRTWKLQKWLPSQKETNLKAKQFSSRDLL